MITTIIKDRADGGVKRKELFETLVRDSYRQAYNFAVRLCGAGQEAEDLVQESYLRAYRFFHRYDETLPFLNWLYRIISNAHIDSMRKRNRIRVTSLDQPALGTNATIDVADQGPTIDRQMQNDSMSEHVQHALVTMTPEFRTAVLLADVEGMAYEEIAEVMNTSVGTVRSRIHRGRKQLRKSLVEKDPTYYGGMCDDM